MFNQWDMSLMQEVIDQVFHTDLVPGEAVALTQNCWFSGRKMVERRNLQGERPVGRGAKDRPMQPLLLLQINGAGK